jgi:hypothetical protein
MLAPKVADSWDQRIYAQLARNAQAQMATDLAAGRAQIRYGALELADDICCGGGELISICGGKDAPTGSDKER